MNLRKIIDTTKTKIGEEQISDEYYDLERRTEIKAASNRLKKQFLTWRECEIVYSLQHRKLLKLADGAGAIYRFDGVVLINREIFEAYLEQFRQEPLTQGQVRKVKNRWEQIEMKGNLWKVSDLLDETDIRFAQKQFFDLRSGYEYYGLTEKVLMRMASEAGFYWLLCVYHIGLSGWKPCIFYNQFQ